MKTSFQTGHLPNTCQHTIQSARGDYLIQTAWPLQWSENRVPADDDTPVSTLYIVDGNAYFFTAVDISRRLEFTTGSRTIVVGIGYPPSKYVYDWRRGPDLTPPTPDGKYDMPLDQNGKPRTDLSFGEAEQFLKFVQDDVVAFIEEKLFSHLSLATGPRALFGHSYGGLFALSTLFTKPTLFDFFIAASPTIFWNNSSLVTYQEAEFWKKSVDASSAPSLVITWGSSVNELEREPDESEDAFQKRKSDAEEKELKPSSMAMVERLKSCSSIRNIWTRQFDGEDHGSAAVVGLQWGMMRFLVERT